VRYLRLAVLLLRDLTDVAGSEGFTGLLLDIEPLLVPIPDGCIQGEVEVLGPHVVPQYEIGPAWELPEPPFFFRQ
jgi:hypothetical protein